MADQFSITPSGTSGASSAWRSSPSSACCRSTSTRRCSASRCILEVIVIAIFDFAILADPGPQGLTRRRLHAGRRDRGRARRRARVHRRLVRRLRVGGDLQRGDQGPQADGRARRRSSRSARSASSTRCRAGCWRTPSAPTRSSTPSALVEGGYTTPDGAGARTRRPRCSSPVRSGSARSTATSATALFCTSLFAALLAFHNAVARYFYALGREGVFPKAFGRVQPADRRAVRRLADAVAPGRVGHRRVRDPRRGPGPQALHVADEHGHARGDLRSWRVTSFAVVAYFRKRPDHELGPVRTMIAPVIGGVLAAARDPRPGRGELQRPHHGLAGRADRHDDDRAAADPGGGGRARA